jgi:hypothetical protein
MEARTAKAIKHIDQQIGKFEELLKELTTIEATLASIERAIKRDKRPPSRSPWHAVLTNPELRAAFYGQALDQREKEEIERKREAERQRCEQVAASYQAARRHLLALGKKYDDLYDETEFVLRLYFPAEDLKKFSDNVVNNLRAQIEAAKKENQEYHRRKRELDPNYLGLGDQIPIPTIESEHYIQASKQCISYLKICRERIEVFGLFGRDTLHFEGDFIMGDTYNVEQAGAVGPGAHAHDMVFTTITTQSGDTIDLPGLAKELSVLRAKMKEKAVEPEHDVAVGAIAEAETAAKKGHAPKVLESLAKAGKWALDMATQIGTPVAIAAIKASLGIQ